MNTKIIVIFFIFFPMHIYAEEDSLLTLKQAIELALKNNFDIRLANNKNEHQNNENTIGNAGMLPNVDLNGTYKRSNNSLKQKYNSGDEVNSNASLSTNVVADLGATWTIFDGLKMFRTKEKLTELSLLSRDQLKIQIENSLEEVIASYYFIVRQKQLLAAIKEELFLSEERIKLAERKLLNGSGSKLDWLQTKTEYNRQRSIEINLKTTGTSARFNLNRLLGRNIEIIFTVEDTVIINYKPAIDELKKSIEETNSVLNYYKKNQRIAKLGLAEIKSFRWPVISLNANYVYSKNTNENGFSLLNQLEGLNYGITAAIPLFHGFNINRQIKNSRLDMINSDIVYESASAKVQLDLTTAWLIFSNNLELLTIEEKNIVYAREVLNIANERFRIGVSNSVEQQEAQRTFEAAMNRLADARYNAKISETSLRRLNGDLVK